MAKERETIHSSDNQSLKGTFVSVLLLGGFLCITWFGAYLIYLYRG